MDTRRLILKLLAIAEGTSICVQPSTTSARPPPPQEAKTLANVLVSSQRVAVFNTGEQSIVRVQYLGDGIIDDDHIEEVTGIGGSQAPVTQASGIILSEGCLTDAEKRSAATFYRFAVKLSVRRVHHLGMPPGGWVVRINTFECMCPYFTNVLSCAHVICGRVAFGLSVPGVGGQHLKFKNRRIRRTCQRDPKARVPPLLRSAPLAPFESVGPSTDSVIDSSPLEQN
ncbi:hypothetical protein PHYSODRAFT_517027 [Phytophthora sojae]|uniref:SWIM-type domain-containing protein n=1 Tax=Phytophthora sojae (strain P6497) TaxID=1094619 RepID=G4ZVZ8_PHYSP|nr:hypothetical protein PHYSODRAFT_517027 [Phytophthora sojae]EGZ11578.1 hypothetical protein PHYSODRAFT_517027 [Phytophthora sojae]|eukprot:XP_009531911.1 hypothetical protein PHYSODRAFT_517027 [Phytophthora sojae]